MYLHGNASPVDLPARPAARPKLPVRPPPVGMFGRLFPKLPAFAQDTAEVRGRLMELGKPGGVMNPGDDPAGAPPVLNPDNPDPRLVVGITFLGQFIDHDLTFDLSSRLDRQNEPSALVNGRTPVLELDSLYGAGPVSHSYLFEDNGGDPTVPAKFLIDAAAPWDVPRNSQNKAIIADPRNDENIIVSQLHYAFMRFHNAVIDRLIAAGQVPREQIFAEAQRLVTWHYQWLVVHEYLPLIVGKEILQFLFRNPQRRIMRGRYIPVEFSAAAFRFGHSQIRTAYTLNADFQVVPVFIAAIPNTNPDPFDLRGGKRAKRRRVEWNRFFLFEGGDPALVQQGKRIDTILSGPLFALPSGTGIPQNFPSLAQRNLLRGLALGLPSGQAIAKLLGVPALSTHDLQDVKAVGFEKDTPLWFYILREAQVMAQGKRLGPVGARIVAEVFVALLARDPHSYLRQRPAWKPTLTTTGEFSMDDLIKIAGLHPPPPPPP